jgi:hypothetical protein
MVDLITDDIDGAQKGQVTSHHPFPHKKEIIKNAEEKTQLLPPHEKSIQWKTSEVTLFNQQYPVAMSLGTQQRVPTLNIKQT